MVPFHPLIVDPSRVPLKGPQSFADLGGGEICCGQTCCVSVFWLVVRSMCVSLCGFVFFFRRLSVWFMFLCGDVWCCVLLLPIGFVSFRVLLFVSLLIVDHSLFFVVRCCCFCKVCVTVHCMCCCGTVLCCVCVFSVVVCCGVLLCAVVSSSGVCAIV